MMNITSAECDSNALLAKTTNTNFKKRISFFFSKLGGRGA